MLALHRLFLLSLPLFLVAACANGGDPYDPNDPRLEQARLEIVGSNTFNLRPGESTDLRVRYVFDDGTNIAQAPIDFAIEGISGMSRLSASRVDTNDEGIATVALDTGTVVTNFSVVATPPVGNSVTFLIAVSTEDVGSISIRMRYTGDETLDSFTPYLFRGGNCDTLNPAALPMAERIGAPVGDIRDRPGFVGIAPASDYVVAVIGTLAGTPAAFGCVVGVTVRAAEETPVDIELMDLAATVTFVGTYDLANRFNFAGVLPPSVETALLVLGELTDDQDIAGNPATEDWGQDPGAFILDIMMRLTCAWECMGGEDYDSCGGFSSDRHGFGDIAGLYQENFTSWSGAESRFFGGCGGYEIGGRAIQGFINSAVASYVPTVVTRFLDAAGDLSRAITDSRIQSALILDPMDEFGEISFDHRLLIMEVALRDLGGVESFFMFEMREVGLTELSRTGLATAVGDTLILPPHSFDLHLGRLVQYIYLNGLLPLFGFETTTEMLETWIDCRDVAGAIHGAIGGVTDRLTEAQYEMYCIQGLAAAGDYVDNNIAGLIDIPATMTINGTARGAMVSSPPDNIAQELVEGMWGGSWDEMGTGDEINGSFTGLRR
jgi:hypothetical protein